MPVKKPAEKDGGHECSSTLLTGYSVMGRKLMCTLTGILLVYSIIFVGTLIRNNLKKYDTIGRAEKMERTITVEADAKVTVTPDIALTTMGMTAEGKTVAEAQKKNNEVIGKLLEKVTAIGVDKKDVQTANYSIYPAYDYNNGNSSIRGYEVNQSVTIKIRDLSKANEILGLAGEVGANNVTGLQFTVEDPESFKEKVRDLALRKVAAKRASLSRSLGVRLKNIVTYNEYEIGSGEMGKGPYVDAMGAGIGASPSIQPGTNEISMRVSVVFEVQ